jgi:2-C-methyl-D-erythritol 4-phosphate cytidylyltransferase
MKVFALIVAGGTGTRMKSDVPKQFMLLNHKPVLMHTIERFTDFDRSISITLVLPANQFDTWRNLCNTYGFGMQHQLVAGGASRFDSVFNGLKNIEDNGVVFIHDGVRPLVSTETLKRCLEKTIEAGNALPVLPLVESIRSVDGLNNSVANRDNFVSVQTPQVFLINEIKAAYSFANSKSFTDDASVLEHFGKKINLVEGNRENIKITYPSDLIFAEALLADI